MSMRPSVAPSRSEADQAAFADDVGALNRVLVAHHQRGDDTRHLPVFDTLEDRLAHHLPGLLDRVPPTCGKPDGRRVVHAGTHIAGSL